MRTGLLFITRRRTLQAAAMRASDFYDHHPISKQQVLAAVARRRGGDLSRLTPDELFEFDQDHYGGLAAVDALARRAGITGAGRGPRVCAGLARPAPLLARPRRRPLVGL